MATPSAPPTTIDIDELNARAQELLPDFREKIGDVASNVSDGRLLKFLRWKPDIQRAADRFHSHLTWKKKNPGLFDDTLRVSRDPELERLLQTNIVIAPPQCRTRAGGPLLIVRLRNNDMRDGRSPRDVCRMVFYTLDRVLEDPDAQIHGVTIVHDLTGFERGKNAHIDIPRTLMGGIIGNFPLRIRAIYLCGAPTGFHTLFAVLSRLFSPKKFRERCHFIQDTSEISKDIDLAMLIKELGGEVDFDSSQWVQEHKQREENGTFVSLTDLVDGHL